MSKRTVAIGSALMLAAGVGAKPAEACFDFESLSPTESGELIAAAEKHLSAGDNAQVLELLAYSPEFASWRHANRRMELVAIANIRTGNTKAGLMSLRFLVRKEPGDPFLLARLAEGLEKSKTGKAEALAILERLDREDLMPDAQAYSVLAALLPSDRAQAATRRCEQLATKKGQCTIARS